MKPPTTETMNAVRVLPSDQAARWVGGGVDRARWLLFLAIAVIAGTTPGFLSLPSMLALLTTLSFVGCVAVGMTMITISGHIMSFSLGATAAAAAVAFVATYNVIGFAGGAVAALVVGALVSGVQGLLIGGLRANPIIVSIAALALIYGVLNFLTGNATINVEGGSILSPAMQRPFGIPIEAMVFAACVLLGQGLLTYTVFGRRVFLIGSGARAAEVVGVRLWLTVSGAYAWAGGFAAVAGILLAMRYNQASMEIGVGYDYDAIAAALVGGVAIHGGQGSMWRTLSGVGLMAVVQVVLLLHGFRQEWQYLIAGLIVLLVILLQAKSRSES